MNKVLSKVLFTGNFPRATIEHGLPFAIGEKDWLISINGPDERAAKPADKFGHVFPFHFDDVDEFRCPPGFVKMSEEQAGVMAMIALKAKEELANVWVHCHAGICRSGAVVEVLSLLGFMIFDDWSPQRLPNTHVFRTLRLQFPELRNSWEEDERIENMWQKWVNDGCQAIQGRVEDANQCALVKAIVH
jgi:hypothetical protein